MLGPVSWEPQFISGTDLVDMSTYEKGLNLSRSCLCVNTCVQVRTLCVHKCEHIHVWVPV